MLQITTSRGSPSHLLWRPPFHQDHSVSAWHNKFGTFQVKIEQKTETRTKQKNETTVADKQRAVHFRTLAIIGVAAACGLSVPPPLVLAAHALRLHTSASGNSCLCLWHSYLWPSRASTGHATHPLCFTAFHTLDP